ncbi:MAG: hypothetical protein IIY06_08445 [Proteobacteria bacterium]|jgi:hypothetical protein|nr:hypothetical protein [Pseudomonadota bacterium]
MIIVGNYIHRSELEDLFWRWLHGQVLPDDPERVTKLIHFNNIYVNRYLGLWSKQLFSALSGSRTIEVPISTKAELKDALVSYPHYHDERIDELVRNYIDHRELYYVETPIHGKLYFAGTGAEHRMVGSQRIKRARRLAEKAARRIIDMIFSAIKQRADDYANMRAQQFGIARSQLLTSETEMIHEFERAEAKIIEDLRDGVKFPKISAPPINDVAGLKVIIEPEDVPKLYDYLETQTRCDIFEIEPHHRENYHATNLIIRGRPKKDMLVRDPIDPRLVRSMRERGLWLGDVQKEFENFVYSGEDEVYVEIIYASFGDLLESEIGRSMHESRITDQRNREEYTGHLARNIEYLVQYIFAFASFPSAELKECAIKVWTHYLPDYFNEVLKSLYRIEDPMQFY